MTEKFYDSIILWINSLYLTLDDIINIYQCSKQCSINEKYLISLKTTSLLSSYFIMNILKRFDVICEFFICNSSNLNQELLNIIMNSNMNRLYLHQLYIPKFTLAINDNTIDYKYINYLDLTGNLLESDVLIDMLYYYSSTNLINLKTLILDDSLQLNDNNIQNIIDIIPSLEKISLARTNVREIINLNINKIQEITFENCVELNKISFQSNSKALLRFNISWSSISSDDLEKIILICTNLKVLIMNYCLKIINVDIISNSIEDIEMGGNLNVKSIKLKCRLLVNIKLQLCKNLEELEIESQIKELDLSMLQQLTVLKLEQSPKLLKLNLLGCKNLTIKPGLEEIANNNNNFVKDIISLKHNKKLLESNNNNINYNRPFNHRRSASV